MAARATAREPEPVPVPEPSPAPACPSSSREPLGRSGTESSCTTNDARIRARARARSQDWNRASSATKYSWKLFNYTWNNATPGEHTLVSRVIDENGNVQLTEAEMPEKPTRWENYAQFPRKLVIS